MDLWFTEYQTKTLGLTLRIKETLHRETTPYQELLVVDTEQYGRMLLLDGCVMTTEQDEFVYHEMMSHVALFTHPRPRRVLVIGGGDGGVVREVLKHPSVEEVVLAEIDDRVIWASRTYLPSISVALDNPRCRIMVGDGVDFVRRHKAAFDVIIVDSTDPIGPAVGLFAAEFYQNVYAALGEDGLFVAQSESPWLHGPFIADLQRRIGGIFPITALLGAHIPTYPSGFWTISVGSKRSDPRLVDASHRYRAVGMATRYYTPELHRATFVLPEFARQLSWDALRSGPGSVSVGPGGGDGKMAALHMDHPGRFMAARPDEERVRFVLFGVPMDFTTSFRPGARFGPGRVREVSYGVEEFSYYQERDLNEVPFTDIGDVAVVYGQVTESLARTRQVAAGIVASGRVPVMIGGEHLCTLPVVEAVLERYPDLVLLQFDAHADLRSDYLGNPLSHACAMRRCLDAGVLPGNLYQFGIRSGTRAEYDFSRGQAHFHPFTVLEPLRQVLPGLGHRPVYVTIDIDVMDPAFAPGTGTPEPGGITSREMIEALRAMRGLNVVGLDVVEVAPALDASDRTAVLGALIIREALLAFTR